VFKFEIREDNNGNGCYYYLICKNYDIDHEWITRWDIIYDENNDGFYRDRHCYRHLNLTPIEFDNLLKSFGANKYNSEPFYSREEAQKCLDYIEALLIMSKLIGEN